MSARADRSTTRPTTRPKTRPARTAPLPRVILHNAVSIDGRIDGFVPDLGLFYGLASRWNEQATLAGCDTLLAAADQVSAGDGEKATAALPVDDSRPLLVVPDSRGRIRDWAPWRRQPYWRDVVVLCARATPARYREQLRRQQVACITAGKERVDFRAALRILRYDYGVKVVRVDSGGTLNGVLLRAGLVDEVSLLVHPCLVGGQSVRSIYRAPDLDPGASGLRARLIGVEQLAGEVIWLRYRLKRA